METKIKKHPIGLYYLFFAEMWERFGYYLMIAIFTMYLEADIADKGWAMSMKESSSKYGTFIALVFLTPFLGGILADRLFGYRKSIIIGGLMMGVGYCLMAIYDMTMFNISCGLVILGNGFFKPNISTLLGNLYNAPEYKANKDKGFMLFYMGINVGAFICTFVAAAMRFKYGWGGAFVAAGVGMFIGIIVFLLGNKHYKHADVLKPAEPGDQSLTSIVLTIFIPAIIFGVIGFFLPFTILVDKSTDAFLFACFPILYYYARIYFKANEVERKPLSVLYSIFLVVIIFWAVFKQNGTALNKWAKLYSEREMPASVLPLAEQMHNVENMKAVDKERIAKDEQFRPIITPDKDTIMCVDFPDYFKNIDAKKMPHKNQVVKLIPTELTQSFNAGWVILLTFPMLGLFAFLRKRNWEPTIPSKIALGILISGLSTLVMVAAVYAGNNGANKVSLLWLVGTYGVVTVGELFLSPMGLSLVSKLAPVRFGALMMGGWFLSTAIGNKLSGVLASFWDTYDNKAGFFLLNFFLLSGAFIILLLLLKRLNKIFNEYTK